MHVADLLAAWNSFYVMVGSSAAALTGLMFVVISLVDQRGRGTSEAGISTFSTPTVVHFSYALFIAALMAVPFHSLVPIELITGAAGAAGIAYAAVIGVRTSRLAAYRPDLEDWCCNVLLPFFAHSALLVGAIGLRFAPANALFAIAAAAITLIFVGIHNAWDVVTFLATGKVDQLPDDPAAGVTKKNVSQT